MKKILCSIMSLVMLLCLASCTASPTISQADMNLGNHSLKIGESVDLSNDLATKNITWESDDQSIASVTGGVVIARGEGTTVITATDKAGNVFTAVISVSKATSATAAKTNPKTTAKKQTTTKKTTKRTTTTTPTTQKPTLTREIESQVAVEYIKLHYDEYAMIENTYAPQLENAQKKIDDFESSYFVSSRQINDYYANRGLTGSGQHQAALSALDNQRAMLQQEYKKINSDYEKAVDDYFSMVKAEIIKYCESNYTIPDGWEWMKYDSE